MQRRAEYLAGFADQRGSIHAAAGVGEGTGYADPDRIGSTEERVIVVARGRVALEQLLSSGKLPSRRQHRTDPDKSALQTIMGEVDELSRDHEQ